MNLPAIALRRNTMRSVHRQKQTIGWRFRTPSPSIGLSAPQQNVGLVFSLYLTCLTGLGNLKKEIMRFISRKFHAVLDYMAGLLLIAAPWLFGFASIAPAMWAAVIVGVGILAMSMFTDYEGGVVKTIPMATHLTMDVIAGLILAASPWLFGFADQLYGPHLILGILAFGAGLFTVSASQPARPHQGNRQRSELRGV